MMTPYSLPAFIVALVAAAAGGGLTSADSIRCDIDKFYDAAAKECTQCTDICDPARGTDYLCQKHIDVCNGKQHWP